MDVQSFILGGGLGVFCGRGASEVLFLGGGSLDRGLVGPPGRILRLHHIRQLGGTGEGVDAQSLETLV